MKKFESKTVLPITVSFSFGNHRCTRVEKLGGVAQILSKIPGGFRGSGQISGGPLFWV